MDGILLTPKPILSDWRKEERPRVSQEMLILRGEDEKRWVGVAPSIRPLLSLQTRLKHACVNKATQSHLVT